jgi:hypothetical protein
MFTSLIRRFYKKTDAMVDFMLALSASCRLSMPPLAAKKDALSLRSLSHLDYYYSLLIHSLGPAGAVAFSVHTSLFYLFSLPDCQINLLSHEMFGKWPPCVRMGRSDRIPNPLFAISLELSACLFASHVFPFPLLTLELGVDCRLIGLVHRSVICSTRFRFSFGSVVDAVCYGRSRFNAAVALDFIPMNAKYVLGVRLDSIITASYLTVVVRAAEWRDR